MAGLTLLGMRMTTESYGSEVMWEEACAVPHMGEASMVAVMSTGDMVAVRLDFGCTIECFVTVSDDYGYGFTLHDPYGIGERRIR